MMLKAVSSVADLSVGWSICKDSVVWVYLGKTHKRFFGNQLYRFIVVDCETKRIRTEFLSSEGVVQYVFS